MRYVFIVLSTRSCGALPLIDDQDAVCREGAGIAECLAVGLADRRFGRERIEREEVAFQRLVTVAGRRAAPLLHEEGDGEGLGLIAVRVGGSIG